MLLREALEEERRRNGDEDAAISAELSAAIAHKGRMDRASRRFAVLLAALTVAGSVLSFAFILSRLACR